MAYEIVMPRLGWTMEEGIFLEWLKQDGDAVTAGDLLCTVEGDKAVNEIESFESGTLRIPPDAPPSGAKVKVGTLLGYVLAPGESAPFARSDAAAGSAHGAAHAAAPAPGTIGSAESIRSMGSSLTPPATAEVAPSEDGKRAAPTISPRARRIAGELGVAWDSLKGSGRTGRIVERDVRAAAERGKGAPQAAPAETKLRISPLARQRAAELHVDMQALAATMPGRRIEVADVEAAAPVETAAVARTDAALPMSPVRRLIAERMSASAQTAAAVTLTTEADATELVRLRKAIAADLAGTDAPAPTYNDLLAKIVAVALLEHPALNATLSEDRIVRHGAVHVGIAVDTERGLLVPVVRDAHGKSVQAIAADFARLVERVRNDKLSPDDLRGGTFTITNLGMYEIDAFTPIINLPECAILGVGRIVAKQVVTDEDAETVAVRKMVALSLTFDHRLVDGGPAARFLQRVKQFVEHPYLWLTR